MPKNPTPTQFQIYSNLQGAYKRIENYSEAELDATIAVLAAKLPNAYEYLNFIDAYFERRNRRNPAMPQTRSYQPLTGATLTGQQLSPNSPEPSPVSFGPSTDGE